jgi:hypothetical protein
MGFLAIVEILTIVVISIIYIIRWYRFASRSTEPALTEWQKSSGYVIVRKRLRSSFRGPFLFSSSNLQAVYLLDLMDKSGRMRVAWACCGTYWGGVFEKPVIVKVVVDDHAEKDGVEPELS